MKKKLLLSVLLFAFLLTAVLFACGKKEVPPESVEPTEPTVVYDREVAEEKYLKEPVSDATAIYYKSTESGAFGNEHALFEVTLLPKEYTELDYICSTGAQCIDSGVAYSSALSFDLKFSDYGTSPNEGGIFGTNGWTFCLSRTAPSRLVWRTKYNIFNFNSFSPYKSYTVQCGESFMRINGTETISQSGGTSYGSQNVLLFKTNMGYGSYKLYYFKIYRGEDIVRNYIPCYRNYDGAAGLYDLVSNKFFGNTTAEDFSTRETVVRAVPNEYWQVEYIESTSKQAIALPEDLDCDWFELDCEFTSSEREMCLLGNREAVATWELFTQPDVPNFYLWIRDVGTTATGASALERSTVSYDYTTSMLIVNEQTVFAKKIPTMPRNLFQCGDGSYLSDARLYGAKFKKSGALVLDLVPCVRKSDFEAGLFDLVNKVFYTNNRGGNFVSGGVISQSGNALNKLRSEYDTQEYLTSSGGQYIDTGIVPASDLKLEVTFGADDITMSNGYLLGNGEGGLEIYLENGSWQVAFGSEKVSGSAIPATKTTICLSGKTLSASWDNNPLTVIAQFTSDLQSSRALTLFATNREGGLLLSDGIFICKFLAENGGAVTDLTPAARVEDGALGMFDLVGDAFSESDGTAFLPKQTILERKLPAGYRLLEYLEGTGTQYIDTGIIDAAGVMYEFERTATGLPRKSGR